MDTSPSYCEVNLILMQDLRKHMDPRQEHYKMELLTHDKEEVDIHHLRIFQSRILVNNFI